MVDQDLDEGRLGRGGSTITQQLVKNLFFTTSRSLLRKGVEFTLAPVAERLLPKTANSGAVSQRDRVGARGVWGGGGVARVVRDAGGEGDARAGGAPGGGDSRRRCRRKPARMDSYSAEILRRMEQTGW